MHHTIGDMKSVRFDLEYKGSYMQTILPPAELIINKIIHDGSLIPNLH